MAPLGSSSDAPIVDESVPPPGIPDPGDDPAVVAIEVGGSSTCNGALSAPDVVLTAGRCLADAMPPTSCPTGAMARVRSPPQIRILTSDSGAAGRQRASARDLLVTGDDATCRTQLGFVFLDGPIDDVVPLSVRATGAAKGDHLRTVGFEPAGDGSTLSKLVRDHLRVLGVTDTELQIAEPCAQIEGGTAIDEASGEIVGIALRPGDGACDSMGSSEVYARTDGFLMRIGEALSRSQFALTSTKGKQRTKKGPIDLGANCARGADCAAGVCVEKPEQEYCSRTCEPHDRCPIHFVCQKSVQLLVCVEH
jgi:hypothetical protein